MPKHNRQRDVYTEGVQYWEAYCDSLNDISGFYNYIGGGKDCNLEECCTIKQSRETQYCSTTYKGRPIYGICCPSSQDNDFCREVHGGLGVFGSSTKSKNGLPGANCNVDTDCKDLYNSSFSKLLTSM